MRTGTAVLLLAAAMIMALPLRVPAAAPDTVRDPLAEDSRLQRRVALSVEGLPIRDLLSLLSERTGVSLAVASDVADEKALVFGPARPLRDVLADLAALFDCRWARERSGRDSTRYRLVRSRGGQQR